MKRPEFDQFQTMLRLFPLYFIARQPPGAEKIINRFHGHPLPVPVPVTLLLHAGQNISVHVKGWQDNGEGAVDAGAIRI